jgi:hypothetical protein
MNAQLKQVWDPWIMQCQFDGNVTLGDDNVGAGYLARIFTSYTPNPSDVNLGILLAIQSTKGGFGPINTTETKYIFSIEDLGITPAPVSVGVFRSSVVSRVEIDAFRLYDLGNYWRLKGDSIRWYIEGALQDTYSGFTLESAANYKTPASRPLIGIDPQMAPAALDGAAPPY